MSHICINVPECITVQTSYCVGVLSCGICAAAALAGCQKCKQNCCCACIHVQGGLSHMVQLPGGRLLSSHLLSLAISAKFWNLHCLCQLALVNCLHIGLWSAFCWASSICLCCCIWCCGCCCNICIRDILLCHKVVGVCKSQMLLGHIPAERIRELLRPFCGSIFWHVTAHSSPEMTARSWTHA